MSILANYAMNDNIEPVMNHSKETITQERINNAKASYNVRNVPLDIVSCALTGDVQPNAGDLVLATVTKIGQHQRIELGSGRRAGLHLGDEIIVCFGSRYAPDQFEAFVPDSLESCHLVAAGGVAARSINRHSKMKRATEILPVGILADAQGQRININDWAIKPMATEQPRPFTVGVLGTSMNAGKTTTAAGIIYALKKQGLKVAAAKVTGTGAGLDRWKMVDAGADIVLDFTDAGLVSTFGVSLEQLELTLSCLMDHMSAIQPDVIVLEIADGLYQKETAALMASDVFKSSVDQIVFAAGESMGAKKGEMLLEREGYSVLAVSGAINASPLAKREAQDVLKAPILQPKEVGKMIYDVLLSEQLITDKITQLTSVKSH